jgi:hypothetical protein
MPPETYFALTLIVKMAVTAAFLLLATSAAERAGPLVGGLVATLPISAGPVYIFLALDHDAHFIAQSALGSLVVNPINAIYAVTYALLAQKRTLAVSIGGAFFAWAVLVWMTGFLTWTLGSAIVFNVVLLGAGFALSARLRHAAMPRVATRWYDLIVRAGTVAVLVGTVVTLSFRIGPRAGGSLAVFPMVLSSIIIILHHRVGGPATAAVMANAVVGLAGFAVAVVALCLTADQLGSAASLTLALAVSMICNLLLFLWRRRALTR